MTTITDLRLLTLTGSLRSGSSNTRLLQAAASIRVDGLLIERGPRTDSLPHFNPDDEQQSRLPEAVSTFRDAIAGADGLIISVPEYARGVPGSFKNALDWLVGCVRFAGTPVALWNASPRATAAQAALVLILQTMSAEIIAEASLTIDLLAMRAPKVDRLLADAGLRAAVEGAAMNMRTPARRRRDTRQISKYGPNPIDR